MENSKVMFVHYVQCHTLSLYTSTKFILECTQFILVVSQLKYQYTCCYSSCLSEIKTTVFKIAKEVIEFICIETSIWGCRSEKLAGKKAGWEGLGS